MQPQQWQSQRKDIFGYIISEKGTGAEICPAIVSGIVTGRTAIGHFFPCLLASDSARILFKSGELFP